MTSTSAKTEYEHVVPDEKGVPIVAVTNMKVIEIVLEKTAYGWSPEELHFQHPYLTLGQIYSAQLSDEKTYVKIPFIEYFVESWNPFVFHNHTIVRQKHTS